MKLLQHHDQKNLLLNRHGFLFMRQAEPPRLQRGWQGPSPGGASLVTGLAVRAVSLWTATSSGHAGWKHYGAPRRAVWQLLGRIPDTPCKGGWAGGLLAITELKSSF